MRHVNRLVPVLILISTSVLCASAQEPPVQHVPNFGKVNDSIYRGGAPTAVGLEELGAMGVKMVIDLREPNGATEVERKDVEKLRIKYISVPIGEFSTPTAGQIDHLLTLLMHPNPGPIFIHCRRGKDRTGTVVACYRIQHDNWTNQKALAEANEYGMSHLERSMRAYIERFRPLPLDAKVLESASH